VRTVISSQQSPTLGIPLVELKTYYTAASAWLGHGQNCCLCGWRTVTKKSHRPTCCSWLFSGSFHEILTEDDLQGIEKTSVTSLWVLSNLTSALQQHLVFSCKSCYRSGSAPYMECFICKRKYHVEAEMRVAIIRGGLSSNSTRCNC